MGELLIKADPLELLEQGVGHGVYLPLLSVVCCGCKDRPKTGANLKT